ncbi:MAG: zinc ribbon domain-containing protein [Chloroflexi bacterium]|nr:zinc ribbon domain-containing protein [Chloroflexota bacterium]
MAIYEYSCETCEAEFQARRAMKDADAPITCPECGGPETRRKLSSFFSPSGGTRASLSKAGSSGGSSSCASCSSSSCSTCGI